MVKPTKTKTTTTKLKGLKKSANSSSPVNGQTTSELIVKKKALSAINEAAVKRTTRKFDNIFVRFLESHENNGEEIIIKLINRLDKRLKFTKKLCKQNMKIDARHAAINKGEVEYEKYKNEAPIIEAQKEGAEIYKLMADYIVQADVSDEQVEIFFNEILSFIVGFTGNRIQIEKEEIKLKKAA